jgi:capsular exopolysaccharide synthesis family protein
MEKNASSAPEPLVSIHWQQLVGLALRRATLFIVCFAVVVLITIIYLVRSPRLYASTATLQVATQEQRQFQNPDQANANSDDLRGDDIIKTIEQNLQNFSIFQDVENDPSVNTDPNFLEGFPSKLRPVDSTDLAFWLMHHTSILQRHGTRLIDVSFEHADPAVTQKVVRSIINAFFVENARAQALTEQAAANFLTTQSEQVKGSLQTSENSLQIYKDALLLKDRIEDEQRVIDALRQRYREKHPQLIQARALMADLMSTFDHEFDKVRRGGTSEGAYWTAHSSEIDAAAPADKTTVELKLVEARANVLQMEVDTESALYDSVLKQHGTADVSSSAVATQVRVSQEPNLPTRPSKPRKTLTLAVGTLLGLIAGAAAVFGANALDSSIKTTVEAEELLGVPVLGAIPLFVNEEKTKGPPRSAESRRAGMIGSRGELIVQTDPGSGTAEGFRSLRAAIGLLGKGKDHRSVLFASALPDEGKTFVSCNHALAVSQTGLKTLLIDTDLRRPSVHQVFNLQNKNGFVEMVTAGLKLEDAVYQDVAKNLDVLTSGARCPNPAELLSGTGFHEVLAAALKSYERVVIDCSPINLVSDSLLIASSINTVCLVIRAAETSRRDAQHAFMLLQRANIKLSGLVLNAVPPWTERLYPHYLGEKSAKYRDAYRYVYQDP